MRTSKTKKHTQKYACEWLIKKLMYYNLDRLFKSTQFSTPHLLALTKRISICCGLVKL